MAMNILILVLLAAVTILFALALVAGRKLAADVHAMSVDELEAAIANCDMWHDDADIYHDEIARRQGVPA
jgi:cell division protein FtsB